MRSTVLKQECSCVSERERPCLRILGHTKSALGETNKRVALFTFPRHGSRRHCLVCNDVASAATAQLLFHPPRLIGKKMIERPSRPPSRSCCFPASPQNSSWPWATSLSPLPLILRCFPKAVRQVICEVGQPWRRGVRARLVSPPPHLASSRTSATSEGTAKSTASLLSSDWGKAAPTLISRNKASALLCPGTYQDVAKLV